MQLAMGSPNHCQEKEQMGLLSVGVLAILLQTLRKKRQDRKLWLSVAASPD